MIAIYKVNMPGPYHIEKSVPCQDAYRIQNKKGIVYTAVADGLGSCDRSDKGAMISSSYVVSYCAGNYTGEMSDENVFHMMRRAFTRAYLKIDNIAREEGNEVEEYDCTLCLAIYDEKSKTLYYGQSGDSGLIAQITDGTYKQVTTQQRDEEGRVYPLCFGASYWKFGKVNDVCAYMLMTDGIWDQMCPPELEKEKSPINVAFAELFLNHYEIREKDIKRLEKSADKYMRSLKRINDDKTLVAVINTETKPNRREAEYYAPIDWDALRKKQWEREEHDCTHEKQYQNTTE